MSKRPLQTIAKQFADDVEFKATTGKGRHNYLLISDSNDNAAVVAAEIVQLLMKKGLEFEVSRIPTEGHPVPEGLTLPTDEDTYIAFQVSPVTAAKRAKKDPNAPKRTMTRYNAFLKIRGPALKEANKDAKPLAVKSLLTSDWHLFESLSESDKEEQYEGLAAEIAELVAADKVRFDTETRAYGGAAPVAAAEPAAKPAADKPKATNGWILYSKQERAAIKLAHPDMPGVEVAQEVAKRWKALGDSGKGKWNAKAKGE
jgi:hypothetical protein